MEWGIADRWARGEQIFGPYFNQRRGGNMVIKVRRLKLIAALETRLKELQTKYEAENKGVLDDVTRYEKEANHCITAIQKRVAAFKAAKTAFELDKARDDNPRIEQPQPPQSRGYSSYDGHDIKQVTKLIAHLNLSEQDEVDCEENAEYMKYL
jgi:hypothetical protein